MWSISHGRSPITRFQNSSRSSSLRASGDTTVGTLSSPGVLVRAPVEGNLPWVAFMLYTPQNAAGILTLPPTSVPISIALPPSASNAAPPPVDAPGEYAGLYGLLVRPKSDVVVSIENRPVGTVVLTCTSAPARCSSWTMGADVRTDVCAKAV